MATITLGSAFPQSVSQTILPVSILTKGVSMRGMPAPVSSQIVGFFPISLTAFTGTETTFTLSSGAVPVTSLTLPPLNTDTRATAYMVASYDNTDIVKQPWRAHPSFVPVEKTGYYSQWIMPVSGITHRFGKGILIGNLSTQLDVQSWTAPSAPSAPQANSTAAISWAVSMTLSNDITTSFFDFNWVELFQAKPPAGTDFNTMTGLAIIPTTQPTNLPFKSTVLQVAEPGPNGTMIYNTIRIVRMVQNITAGDYAFGFNIVFTDANGAQSSTPVTLTITVV